MNTKMNEMWGGGDNDAKRERRNRWKGKLERKISFKKSNEMTNKEKNSKIYSIQCSREFKVDCYH